MLQLGERKLPQNLGKENLTLSLTKSASIGYFSVFFAFISRYVMPIRCRCHFHSLQIQIHFHCQFNFHYNMKCSAHQQQHSGSLYPCEHCSRLQTQQDDLTPPWWYHDQYHSEEGATDWSPATHHHHMIQSQQIRTPQPWWIWCRGLSLTNISPIPWAPMTTTSSMPMTTTSTTHPSMASASAGSSRPCAHARTCTCTTWLYSSTSSHYYSITTASTTASSFNQSSLNCFLKTRIVEHPPWKLWQIRLWYDRCFPRV